MTYLRTQDPDISIITRVRLRAWPRALPALRVSLSDLLIYSGIAILHLLAATLFLVNTASGQAAGLHSLPLDEAWGRLVYARSFAEHFAFYYNPGVLEAGVTSPLWVILVGLSYQLLGFTGITLAVLAKILGIALAIGASIVALKLTIHITGNKTLGVIAATIIALEPGYSFAKVSGMEASLFGFATLAAAASFYSNKLRLTGALLALAVTTRPEGVLLVLLAAAALMLKILWERGDFRQATREDVVAVVKVAGLPALVALGIVSFNFMTNGTPYPNSYLVKRVPLGLFNYANLWNLTQGYLFNTSFFGGLGILATIPLLVLAGIASVRQSRFGAVPLLLFPFTLYYALAVTMPLEPNPWSILTRSYLDPALPFVAVGLAVGSQYARRLLRKLVLALGKGAPHRDSAPSATGAFRLRTGAASARWVSLGLTIALLALLFIPYIQFPSRWVFLTAEYSWNSRNVDQVNVAAARWIDQSLPADAVIGAVDGGAIRFFGNRRVVDLTGLNTHTAIGRPLFKAAEEHNIDYLVAFRNIYFDSWPSGEEIYSFPAAQNPASGGSELVVYRMDWGLEVKFADKSIPHTVDISGLRLLDSLDVGDQTQEEAHFYSLSQPGAVVERIFHVNQENGTDIDIKDEARTSTGPEEFVVKSAAGRPLIIVKRYDAAVGGSVNVYADDVFVGEWKLAPRDFVFGEDAFRIGPGQVKNSTTKLRFEYLKRPGASLNSFYYWIYTTG